MSETSSFKIFISLILTILAAFFWVYIQSARTVELRPAYEDAVFVENTAHILDAALYTGRGDGGCWKV